MSKPINETKAIETLVAQLSAQVSANREHFERIQQVVGDLSADHASLLQEETMYENPVSDEALLLSKLELDRLDLVMDLQHQDSLKEKLLYIIDENANVISLVLDKLKNKDRVVDETRFLAENRFQKYQTHSLDPTITHLNSILRQSKQIVKNVATRIESSIESTEFMLDSLESDEFSEKLVEFVNCLNKAYFDPIVNSDIDQEVVL